MCWTLPDQASKRGRRRRAAALAVAAALVAGLTPACAPPRTPAANAAGSAREIDMRTPAGLRAQQTLDMLNSDWPIGPVGIGTLAAPKMVPQVQSMMEKLWWDRPFTLNGVDIKAGAATLKLTTSYGAQQEMRIHTDDDTMVDGFDLTTLTPKISSFSDVDAVLGKTKARYSWQATKVTDGQCRRVAGTNTELSLPLASIFKLYVLDAVSDAIKAGTLSWDDQLTVTEKGRAVGSSMDLPVGARISVRTAAEKMIATSDNMATDMLIERVGPQAVDDALVKTGHHDPAAMTPFPTMYELFTVAWGRPDVREQWKNGTPEVRAQMLQRANSATYQPDPFRAHVPASESNAEWYGNADDICRVHVALQAGAVGPAAPVKNILDVSTGVNLDRNDWPYIAAKAGGLPGDLTFSWYAIDKERQPWVVSFQLNWPRDHGPAITGWMLQIAKQVFALLRTQR
ncbi:class A beta-lactamase-related serine hydrolase [Mycobacterium paraterrae]|uniref:Class A beta-lactamase-related serine hydrolase n=1 Tax=Mycobacterium paraterrae TaxID=577492 RepID=A0ABY3VL83_9MYCO|nr:class A beta-lactamase-related serine hydrolase [Mycobacterium paraterrae]UMB70185.1 class A beta-lactamase-related serine hydrolase [Mycobacterium paraterrae]